MTEACARNDSMTVHSQSLQYYLDNGDFRNALTCPRARTLFGGIPDGPAHNLCIQSDPQAWDQIISERIQHSLEDVSLQEASVAKQEILLIGVAALRAFLQSNVTGPPLAWHSANIIFPKVQEEHLKDLQLIRRSLVVSLTVDGEAIYQLTPNVELFSLAKIILTQSSLVQGNNQAQWERLRVNFWHQRMLSEIAPSLQENIYEDLEHLDTVILSNNETYDDWEKACFLLERAAINVYHGFDSKAREDLERAAKLTGFEYVLTGRLGKRTKFQEKELSQLVVLAKSADEPAMKSSFGTNGITNSHTNGNTMPELKPQNYNLNDDTLLEAISFSKPIPNSQFHVAEQVPPSLANLDPANQPVLAPLDSIILLSYASSITNTSPQDGLTREETLPYATRVLDGGSSNWQIYTQALLVRSRIEAHRSRTVERGVLQLQALVDQVVVETTSVTGIDVLVQVPTESINALPSTFLPRPKTSEAAPVTERLKYVHQLAPPTRWTLEAELAARWVSLGGLRTALEIYERLHMWAEAALCWAAVEREDKARRIVRRQLYHSASPVQPTGIDEEAEEYLGKERSPLPVDAPRLFCILGDIDKSPAMYERAWTVSNERFARAQRSLGKHYLASRDLLNAEKAYSKSLKINPQNQVTWFELGCVRLEVHHWGGAVDAFTRAIQIDETDAEAWSNLAAALLRLPPEEVVATPSHGDSAEIKEGAKADPQKHSKEALVAFKRAAALKRESYRIWQNLLNVAAILSPPPYADIIIAQERLIELRGPVEGENCIDVEVMEGLLSHVIASAPAKNATEVGNETTIPVDGHRQNMFGLEHMTSNLIQKQIIPLITHSRRLWQLVARFSLLVNHPSSALDAYEKAWRVTVNKPGWDSGTSNTGISDSAESPEDSWSSVVDATVELADAYESLGEREKTEGLAVGSGELVCKGWKFKSRSAIRTVMGRARERWEDSEGWKILENHIATLKTA